jgi:hypothetical protein
LPGGSATEGESRNRGGGIGRHEPPTKRSFWFSLATSTLRALILIAAIALAVVLIKNAFPSNATQGVGPPGTQKAASPGVSPSPSPSPTHRPGPSPTPQITGILVEVRNGTSQAGLSNSNRQTLQAAGFSVKPPGNAPLTDVTFIYYKPGLLPTAQYLKQRFFPTARLVARATPALTDPKVQIEIVLGADFAAGSGPSPSP